MKWELVNLVGFTYTFSNGSSSLTLIAANLDEAIRCAGGLLREGVKIDVSGWEE